MAPAVLLGAYSIRLVPVEMNIPAGIACFSVTHIIDEFNVDGQTIDKW